MKNILKDIPDAELTPEQEQQLALQKSPENLELLVMGNIRQAFFYGRRCFPHLDECELLSTCYTALVAAAKNFKPGMLRFFSFAKPSIRGALSKYLRTKDVVKRGPRETEALPAPEEAVEDEDTSTVRQPVEQAATMPAFEQLHLTELWAEVSPLLHKALTPDEAMVLDLNFRGGLNLREIGQLRGCSRAAMSLIKLSALKKLRRALLKAKKISSIDL